MSLPERIGNAQRETPLFHGIKSFWANNSFFGPRLPAGELNHEIQDLLSHLLDCLVPGNNRARVNADDVRHFLA